MCTKDALEVESTLEYTKENFRLVALDAKSDIRIATGLVCPGANRMALSETKAMTMPG